MTDWTDTPPTEAGWYWWRESAQAPQSFCTEIDDEGDAWITADFWQEASTFGGQWWPVPIPRPGEGTDPLMLLDTKTGKVTVVECERCGTVDWRAVAEEMRADLESALSRRFYSDPDEADSVSRDAYDAAVARNTKGGE